jgi:RTA1 like protein
MGRMIWNFVADAKVYCLTAWRFSSLFVVLDIGFVSISSMTSTHILTLQQCSSHPDIWSSNCNEKSGNRRADSARYEWQYHDFVMSAEHNLGLHIYMVGVGIQQAFILLFGLFATKFHRTLLAQSRQGGTVDRNAWILLYALYATLTLITVRDLPQPGQTIHY